MCIKQHLVCAFGIKHASIRLANDTRLRWNDWNARAANISHNFKPNMERMAQSMHIAFKNNAMCRAVRCHPL